MSACMCTCMPMYVSICMNVCIHVYIYIYIYILIPAPIQYGDNSSQYHLHFASAKHTLFGDGRVANIVCGTWHLYCYLFCDIVCLVHYDMT